MKTALVTGADKGIGFEIARHLGKSGWKVILGARNEFLAKSAMEKLLEDGADIIGWSHINLSDNEGLEADAKAIAESYPSLKLLVNNAGIPGDMACDSYDSSVKDISATLQVNYVGTYVLTSKLLPLLAANRGRIVNITVPTEVSPYWHPMAYVASKAAQNVMMRIFAMDFERKNLPVEIFSVHPGATSTDLNNHYSGPGVHMPDVIGEKVAGIVNDGKKHNGEFIELYPIVDEGNY